MLRLDRVISVAAEPDGNTWWCTQGRVLTHIKADRYQLLVPADELAHFRNITDRAFEVIAENEVLNGLTKETIAAKLPPALKHRAGWYLQQFVKINAVRAGHSQSVNLIWDADTLPVRDLQFVEGGRLRLYQSRKIHPPYFDTIERLISHNRTVEHSFIAQCMAVRWHWVDGLCRLIENRFCRPWTEAVLASLDHRHISEFSEYGTLGTYLTAFCPGEYRLSNRPWERHGYSLFGDPQTLSAAKLNRLGRSVDFIAFEKWDAGKSRRSRLWRQLQAGYWRPQFLLS